VFDIELPAHFAKQYFFRYTVNLTRFQQLRPNLYSYRYSMKVRYPPPAEDYLVVVGLHPNDRITLNCGGAAMEIEEDLLADRGHKDMFAGRE
jgi:hypothetical protein